MQSICRDKCKIFVENCKEFKGTNAKYLWGLMQSICGDQGKVFVGTATNANAAISIRHPLPQYRECKALILVLLFRPRFTSCEWLPLFMMNTPPDIKRIACNCICHLQLLNRYYNSSRSRECKALIPVLLFRPRFSSQWSPVTCS